jgi:hypothetical protein
MADYDFKLSNGTDLIALAPHTVPSLEANGPGSLSTPRQILDISFSSGGTGILATNYFVLDDSTLYLRAPFNTAGNTLNIVNSPYAGTYTVATVNPLGTSTIVNVTTPISLNSTPFNIIGVNSSLFKWTVGVTNGPGLFYPGGTITVQGNVWPAANGTYTIPLSASFTGSIATTTLTASSVTGTISIGQLVPGVAANTWIVNQIGGTPNGAGTYTVSVSQTVASGPMTCVPVWVSGGATYVVVSGAISGSATVSGNIVPPAPVAYPIVLPGVSGPGTGQFILYIAGNYPLQFTTGYQLIVKGNAYGSYEQLTIASSPLSPFFGASSYFNGTNTEIIVGPVVGQPRMIIGVDHSLNNVIVAGDQRAIFFITNTFTVTGSGTAGADGTYTVSASPTLSSGNTLIPVTGILATGWMSGIITPVTPVIDATGVLIFPVPAQPYGYLQYATQVSSPLELLGRGSPYYNTTVSWGQAIQDNSVHILENFASALPPAAPLSGQQWYDTSTPALNTFGSTKYTIVSITPTPTNQFTITGDATAVITAASFVYIYGNATLNTGLIPVVKYTVLSSVFASGVTTVTTTTAITAGANVGSLGYAYSSNDWHNIVVAGFPTQADINMNGHKITNLGTPTSTTDAVTKAYADALIIGLLNDRGNWNASANTYPATGGSGTGGAVRKGDTWFISVVGTLNGVLLAVGDTIRALVDTPGQINANWDILQAAGTVDVVSVATNAVFYPTFVSATSGSIPLDVSTGLTFNPSTNILTTTGFTGALNGTVGAVTPAAGAFTTLTGTGTISLSPASLNVTISPTGTGTVTISPVGALTINPTAASTINNTSIGATTAGTGRFTTLGATGAVTLSPASFNVVLSPTGTGVVTINPATLGSIDNVNVGATTASTGRFTTVQSTVAIGTAPFTVTSTTPVTNLSIGGNAGTATIATNANNIAITAVTTAAAFYPVFVSASTGNLAPDVSVGLTFNPSTNVLTTTGFAGALTGTVGAVTPAAGAFTTLSASSTVTLSPASANVAISPTGTGTVTVSPAGTLTLGIAGVSISALGNISAITSNQTITLSPTGTGTVTISPVGALTVAPTAASTINNCTVGVTTPLAGNFTTIGVTTAGTGKFTAITMNAASNTITPGTTGGIVGTTLADNAQAGSIGEVIQSAVIAISAIALTVSGTAYNVTSISLTAGDWDVFGTVGYAPAATTTITALSQSSNATTGAQAAFPNTSTDYTDATALAPGAVNIIKNIPTRQFNVSVGTTVYLVATATFGTSTITAGGQITARRRR